MDIEEFELVSATSLLFEIAWGVEREEEEESDDEVVFEANKTRKGCEGHIYVPSKTGFRERIDPDRLKIELALDLIVFGTTFNEMTEE